MKNMLNNNKALVTRLLTGCSAIPWKGFKPSIPVLKDFLDLNLVYQFPSFSSNDPIVNFKSFPLNYKFIF